MTTEASPFAAAAIPDIVEWRLYNARRHEERTYTQTELALDGEARLITIGMRVGAVLAEGGYTWSDIADLFDDDREIDWTALSKLIAHVAQYAPALLAEAATVLLGIFPTDEDGQPNPEYEGHLHFIRSSINLSRFVEMARIFIGQNDYARMLAPFSQTLAGTMDAIAGGSSSGTADSPEPSSEQRVKGLDGSTLDLVPIEPRTTDEAPESATGTPSDSSPS